ncbi:MAG: hypothetical protein U0R49_04895 [Fimbriimonadales bacterium]
MRPFRLETRTGSGRDPVARFYQFVLKISALAIYLMGPIVTAAANRYWIWLWVPQVLFWISLLVGPVWLTAMAHDYSMPQRVATIRSGLTLLVVLALWFFLAVYVLPGLGGGQRIRI